MNSLLDEIAITVFSENSPIRKQGQFNINIDTDIFMRATFPANPVFNNRAADIKNTSHLAVY